MAYIGYKPADKPLTSADITDGIITTAKIADGNITSTKILDGTILNADINASAAIVGTKLSGVNDAKAWISFNGTGTPAITGSFNVTSITDHGTGNYTINFTTALSDANYCMTGAGDNNGNSQGTMVILDNATTAPAAGSCRIMTRVPNVGVASDGVRINCAFFR